MPGAADGSAPAGESALDLVPALSRHGARVRLASTDLDNTAEQPR